MKKIHKSEESKFLFLFSLIKYPLITEKSIKLYSLNKYTFLVNRNLKKSNLFFFFEKLLKTSIFSINTLVLPLKKKMQLKSSRKKAGYKKIIITLKKKIQF
jgi:ribosomal protein L23